MASSAKVVERLIDKLIEKTTSKAIHWEQALEGNKYQARFEEYIVQIEEQSMSVVGGNVSLTVKKLDGTRLMNAGSGVLLAAGPNVALFGDPLSKLERLYALVDTRTGDLERLIGII